MIYVVRSADQPEETFPYTLAGLTKAIDSGVLLSCGSPEPVTVLKAEGELEVDIAKYHHGLQIWPDAPNPGGIFT